MLVLTTRKVEQKIRIDNDIVITILEIKGSHVSIGKDAPKKIPIVSKKPVISQQILDEIKELNRTSIMKKEEILN